MAEEDASVEDAEFEIGTDLGGDGAVDVDPDDESISAPSVAPTSESDQTPEFDPMTANWAALRDDQVPDEYKPLARIGRSMNANHARAMSDARQLREQAQSEYETIQSIRSASQNLATNGSPQQQADPMASTLQQYGYTPGSDGYDEASTVYKIATDIANAAIAPYADALSSMHGDVNDLMSFAGNIQQSERSQRDGVISSEYDEFLELYSEADLAPISDSIIALRGRPSPTGEPFTIKTAFELLTNRAAQQADNMAQAEKQVRSTARSRVAPSPTANAGDQDIDFQNLETDEDIDAALRKLGFQ